jgi:hypothetical protein
MGLLNALLPPIGTAASPRFLSIKRGIFFIAGLFTFVLVVMNTIHF